MTGGYAVYRRLTTLLEPLAGPGLEILARRESRRLHRERLAQGTLDRVDSWWHAASLGEVGALEPVLERAGRGIGTGRLLVTTTTLAGRRAAAERWGGRVSLAPLDFPRIVRRALAGRSPTSLIIVETELWPNWLAEALARGVRVAVVNGRLSDRSWPRYRRWVSVFRPHLSRVTAVAARSDEDADRFVTLGAPLPAVRVTGNTKHDQVIPAAPARIPWTEGALWTVGSLRKGEETPVLEAFTALRHRHSGLHLALVPRHPASWPDLKARVESYGLQVALRTRPGPEDARAEVLVVDTHGELGGFYAAATVCFVGGTLVPVGGHNLMEAAMVGRPVLFGPHTANVLEESRALLASGGGRQVRSAAELTESLDRCLRTAKRMGTQARRTAEDFRGASDRTLSWLVERGVLPSGTDVES